jgi:2-oxoglutarate ferredoxin oxidoreductase subunit alpha
MHDIAGITSEDPKITREMSDKRQLKGQSLARDLEGYETVKVFGDKKGKTALLCWGSNKRVCMEAAEKLGTRVVQVLVLCPFPEKRLKEALQGVERLIAIECNATAQLARLCGFYGFVIQDRILKYDGRPFSLDDLNSELDRVQIGRVQA